MSKLISALTSGDALTANGAITNSTTDSALLDLFAVMGSLRGQTEDAIINLWIKAFNEHNIYALQMLLWCRDCRGQPLVSSRYQQANQLVHLVEPCS